MCEGMVCLCECGDSVLVCVRGWCACMACDNGCLAVRMKKRMT